MLPPQPRAKRTQTAWSSHPVAELDSREPQDLEVGVLDDLSLGTQKPSAHSVNKQDFPLVAGAEA